MTLDDLTRLVDYAKRLRDESERDGRLALALELRAARDRGELDQALALLWEQTPLEDR